MERRDERRGAETIWIGARNAAMTARIDAEIVRSSVVVQQPAPRPV
jgi:hypothetical protein